MEENFNSRKKRKERESRVKRKLIKYTTGIVILLVLISIFWNLNLKANSIEYLDYTESADVDYTVYLNENEYYENEYQGEDEQYVSSLIDSVKVNFRYSIGMEDNVAYTYKYRIEATVYIEDTTTKNSLYSKTSTLVAETTAYGTGVSDISEQLNLEYSEYNETVYDFINEYNLSTQTDSTLNIKLYVKPENADESVITLTVPLAEKTIAITKDTNLVTESSTQIANVKDIEFQKNGSIFGMIVCLAGIIALIGLIIKSRIDSSSEENMYKSERNELLRTYGSVINKIDNYDIQFDKYHIFTLNSFIDLLKIKEDISKPILMVENKEKTNTIFFIPNDPNMMYVFILGKKIELLAETNTNYNDENVVEEEVKNKN